MLGLFKEWGLDAHIEEFEALIPTPTVREVEVLGPKRFVAKLKEPVVAEDPNSGDAHQFRLITLMERAAMSPDKSSTLTLAFQKITIGWLSTALMCKAKL